MKAFSFLGELKIYLKMCINTKIENYMTGQCE